MSDIKTLAYIEIEGEEPVALPLTILRNDLRISLLSSASDPAPQVYRLVPSDNTLTLVRLA